ncbi:MAG: CarD family transcriptional regulator [Bdellovibrionaceae bacterium]|jgi:CarD family transcriptional regulator|nr:CarD family transcriptional regulator [Pseudobdellovibrionaceae bacterium]
MRKTIGPTQERIRARARSRQKPLTQDFQVGDRAVYPGHGVGVVVGIETKEIMGARSDFYVVEIQETGMKVLVPKRNAAQVGLRPVISRDEADSVLQILKDRTSVKMDHQTWNRRYREYMEKIKTGSIYEIAEVLRDLYWIKTEKAELSFGEKNMMDNARKLLLKELTIAFQESELKEMDGMGDILGL